MTVDSELADRVILVHTEIAQRQKSMQESGRRDGHERHGGRGMSKQDSFTSDGGMNV